MHNPEMTIEQMVAKIKTPEFQKNLEWFFDKCIEHEDFIWGDSTTSYIQEHPVDSQIREGCKDS